MLTDPLYTASEAASYLGVSPLTVTAWTRRSTDGVPLMTGLAGERFPIPFVGFAEGVVLTAFWQTGLSMKRLGHALEHIARLLDVDYALAHRCFRVEGPALLDEYASAQGDRQLRLLTVMRPEGRVFHDLIEVYLNRLEYGDEYVVRVRLPITEQPLLVADPQLAFGAAIFIRGGARWVDVVSRIRAGEGSRKVAADFGVPVEDVSAALALGIRVAA